MLRTQKKINYYTIDIQGTVKTSGNYTKLFLGSDEISSPHNTSCCYY